MRTAQLTSVGVPYHARCFSVTESSISIAALVFVPAVTRDSRRAISELCTQSYTAFKSFRVVRQDIAGTLRASFNDHPGSDSRAIAEIRRVSKPESRRYRRVCFPSRESVRERGAAFLDVNTVTGNLRLKAELLFKLNPSLPRWIFLQPRLSARTPYLCCMYLWLSNPVTIRCTWNSEFLNL